MVCPLLSRRKPWSVPCYSLLLASRNRGLSPIGQAFTEWAKQAGMAIRYIQPGRPNQNAYIERFNRTYREELLDQHLFASLEDVREATYWWMIEYDEQRPHDSLGDLTPMEAREQAVRNSTLELSS